MDNRSKSYTVEFNVIKLLLRNVGILVINLRSFTLPRTAESTDTPKSRGKYRLSPFPSAVIKPRSRSLSSRSKRWTGRFFSFLFPLFVEAEQPFQWLYGFPRLDAFLTGKSEQQITAARHWYTNVRYHC